MHVLIGNTACSLLLKPDINLLFKVRRLLVLDSRTNGL